MANLSDLTSHAFAPLFGREFQVSFGEETVLMKLAQVEDLSGSGSTAGRPFGLIFDGPRDPKWQQGIYQFDIASLGALTLFAVPIGEDASCRKYEVVFN